MALCYEFGLVSLDILHKTIGLTGCGESLKDSRSHTQVELGKNLVCCIPNKFSYDAANKALLKYQLNTNNTELSCV